MARIGYIRVSTVEQNTARQLDGVELDKAFTDKASGRTRDRAQLEALMDYAREGDTVFVHSLDRLARNVVDLQTIIGDLNTAGVTVEVVTQGLRFTGDDNPMSRLLLQMLGAVAEFELATIRERQAEGIAKARKRGAYRGRKPALSAEQIAEMTERLAAGASVTQVARDLGVTRQTVYNYRAAS
ncbi:recombinase family protein [Gordonia tangerina]|uniref:Recombinase family protein n=1 Tax=Gordonia tangerina TaxID=2911060 RepID=A0ABS9DD83_9ACTN|nr:recombinase family protein [Gordonia tangerina]MCF3937180.1 recombinase family protein [Gordonia tangerina]